MKFLTTSYHFNLLRDLERLSAFYEAINDFFLLNKHKINITVLDIGCGSGVLSYFALNHAESIIAIEKDVETFKCAKENLKNFNNIELINSDVLDVDFKTKADLVICEMLDTALIDEEEVIALNYIHDFLNPDFQIIPEGIINYAELVWTNRDYLHYEDETVKNNYEIISNSLNYSNFDFSKKIDRNFRKVLEFDIIKDSILNSIKITTFTKVFKNIISGPTPMMNPEIFIPLPETKVKAGDKIKIHLEYIMGGGLDSIKTDIIR
ncbi:methyltransferase domain-containing protein [Methanobrevibacter sp. OttesenSCG-928-I08]|nr:methyltransferase domain-containing protein [Methanobrevibacter sp. OttesenSCG-928-I08]